MLEGISMSDCPVLRIFINPNDSSDPTGLSTKQLSSFTFHCNHAAVSIKAKVDY